MSTYADADKQGLVQGMVTGMRGLCNGLGPAVYGFVFNLFNVDLTHNVPIVGQYPGGGERGALLVNERIMNSSVEHSLLTPSNQLIPGPPFVFGALLVLLAILVTAFIPELIHYENRHNSQSENSINYSTRNSSKYYYTSVNYQRNDNQCVPSSAADRKASPVGSAEEDNTCDHTLGSMKSPLRKSDDNRYAMHKRGTTGSEVQLPLMHNAEPL